MQFKLYSISNYKSCNVLIKKDTIKICKIAQEIRNIFMSAHNCNCIMLIIHNVIKN